jgi:hypothetical protein
MSADDLGPLFERSRIVRAAGRAGELVRAAARSSAIAAIVRRAGRRADALAPAVRVRLAGIAVVTAVATERLLVPLIPAQVRPAPPIALPLWIAAAGAALVAAAPALVRAWPTSGLRAVLMESSRRR